MVDIDKLKYLEKYNVIKYAYCSLKSKIYSVLSYKSGANVYYGDEKM